MWQQVLQLNDVCEIKSFLYQFKFVAFLLCPLVFML